MMIGNVCPAKWAEIRIDGVPTPDTKHEPLDKGISAVLYVDSDDGYGVKPVYTSESVCKNCGARYVS